LLVERLFNPELFNPELFNFSTRIYGIILGVYSLVTLFAASILSPFFVEVTPEVRTTYVSLGKIVEDRPLQVTDTRIGFDTGDFGRFGIRNWEVSSLSGRRSDAHRHACYHSEFGPTWQYDINFAEDWRLKSDLTRSWTLYRGFRKQYESSNRSYDWWQLDQSLENPYLVPFYRIRRCTHGRDFLYFKAGLRRKIPLFLECLSVTPSVFAEGGNARGFKRTFGKNIDGSGWGGGGVSSISFRLELGWRIADYLSAYAYVEQYDVVGGNARRTNAASTFRCAHNDWTHGGFGLRLRF